jgi:hypothetical protein
MAPSDGADNGNASLNSQYALGTQPAHLARSRPTNDELQLLGAKSLEPVLAGNTKRAELRPQAHRAQNSLEATLLGMLKKSGNHLQPRPAKSEPSPAESTPPPQASPRHPGQPTDRATESPTVIPPVQSDTREGASPVPTEHLETPRRHAQPKSHKLDKMAAECPWMKGFHFTRESTVVPKDQASILNKPESWYKPQPGYRFPPANIPMAIFTTLSRLADEKAALNASSDSDDMDIEPTPDSYPTTGEQRSLPVTQIEKDDDSSISVVSWSSSPVLSPQPPVGRFNNLPPDSSLGSPEAVRRVQLADRMPSLPPDSSDDAPMDISPLPDSRIHHRRDPLQQTQGPEIMDSSNGPAPEAPRSSPPVIELLSSDNEMETAVPHALGEDSVERANSVVQVERTPYAKGRSGQTAHPLPPTLHKQTSYDGLHNTSSTSVIYDTCNVANAPATTQGCDDREASLLASTQIQPPPMTSLRDKDSSQAMGANTLNKEPSFYQSQSAPTPTSMSAQILSKDSSSRNRLASFQTSSTTLPMRRAISPPISSPSKRKLNDSPSKSSKRKAKRREIKVVGFGDTPEKVALKQEEDVEMDAIPEVEVVSARDVMSPRHQSLYDTPSAEERPVEQPAPAIASTPLRRPNVAATHITLGAQTSSGHGSSPVAAKVTHSQTIFQRFKTAYPEYTGDEKHFTAQCKQMLDLDSEDKMVPKWQWDDYLIRNRTDYKDYVMQCLDQGESFEPHYRFYKDNIRNTIYVEGILGSREALATALDELRTVPAPAQRAPPPPSQPKKPARTSLPWSPDVPRHRSAGASPRHSLPARSHAPPSTTPAPQKPQERPTLTPRPNLLTRQSTDKAPPTTGTGDAYRDYVFAAMRTTSWTGSTRVSSSARRD